MATRRQEEDRRRIAESLNKPKEMTCAQCGSRSLWLPSKQPKKLRGYHDWFTWAVQAAKGICPHCTPLPRDKWPEWHHGKVVKPCGCGSASCPVPAYAASKA